MSYKVTVNLRNDSLEDILCVIPKGQIFENKKVGTGFQNLAVTRDYRLIIPSGSRISAELDAFCVNRSLSSPKGGTGNVSIFKIDKPFSDQDELWRMMSKSA
jgi:hypothetical protein